MHHLQKKSLCAREQSENIENKKYKIVNFLEVVILMFELFILNCILVVMW